MKNAPFMVSALLSGGALIIFGLTLTIETNQQKVIFNNPQGKSINQNTIVPNSIADNTQGEGCFDEVFKTQTTSVYKNEKDTAGLLNTLCDDSLGNNTNDFFGFFEALDNQIENQLNGLDTSGMYGCTPNYKRIDYMTLLKSNICGTLRMADYNNQELSEEEIFALIQSADLEVQRYLNPNLYDQEMAEIERLAEEEKRIELSKTIAIIEQKSSDALLCIEAKNNLNAIKECIQSDMQLQTFLDSSVKSFIGARPSDTLQYTRQLLDLYFNSIYLGFDYLEKKPYTQVDSYSVYQNTTKNYIADLPDVLSYKRWLYDMKKGIYPIEKTIEKIKL